MSASRGAKSPFPAARVGGFHQHFDGVPVLTADQEFVAFLWTGPSGRTQMMGLSQGFFDVSRDAKGHVLVHRKPTSDLMFAAGSSDPVSPAAIEMPLEDLVAKIRSVMAAGGPTPQ